MNRDQLRERFPDFTIKQDPDPDCYKCKGEGYVEFPELKIGEVPCLCACMKEKHSEDKQAFMRRFGATAQRTGMTRKR